MILDIFYPDGYIKSTYDIDYKKLYEEGIRGIIFDIDNTLVPHGAHADKRAEDLFSYLNGLGFRCLLLSNNRERRVSSFALEVRYTDYIHKAGKPGKAGYIRAMEKMGTNRDNTVFIGDQLFTDIWGAKRSGIRSILVGQIDKREEIQIVLKRILEKVVLYFYFKSKSNPSSRGQGSTAKP